MNTFSHDRLSVYNVGDNFLSEQTLMDKSLLEDGKRYGDVVHIVVSSGEYWMFDYGVIVFWGVDEAEQQTLINRVFNNEFKKDTELQNQTEEHFRFVFSNELKITKDTIHLPDEEQLTRLAVSHALAQSAKLIEYEFKAQNTIIEYSHLPEALAKTGKISLTRKQIAKVRGALFSTKSDIILHYGLLDTPQFFWEYPEYEALYLSFRT